MDLQMTSGTVDDELEEGFLSSSTAHFLAYLTACLETMMPMPLTYQLYMSGCECTMYELTRVHEPGYQTFRHHE